MDKEEESYIDIGNENTDIQWHDKSGLGKRKKKANTSFNDNKIL